MIVVVEEVVDEAVIRADPNRTIIPGLIVDAVVVEPWGAHPSYVQGAYDRDNRFYLDWDPISRDEAAIQAWLGEWVHGLTVGRSTSRSSARSGSRRCGRRRRRRPARSTTASTADGHGALPRRRRRRAVAFYVDRLGFDGRAGDAARVRPLRRGDLSLWLAGPPRRRPGRCPTGGGPSPVAGIASSSRSTTLHRPSRTCGPPGATFRNDIVTGPGGQQILVDDPDGNPIELFEARVSGRVDDPRRRAVPLGHGRRPARIQANVDAMTRTRSSSTARPPAGDGRVVRAAAHRGPAEAGRRRPAGCVRRDLPPDRRAGLARCDACLRIGGPSEGADRMVDGRARLGKASSRAWRGREPVTDPAAFSKSEMMIVAAARELAGQRVCFVGVGLPNIAVNLAKRTVAPGPRARLRGRRVRGPAGPAAAEHRRPDDRHRRDRGHEHVRAVRVLPPGRADRRRVPGRGPDRPVRQHQHDGHRRLRPAEDAAARQRRRLRDRDQRPPGVRDHAPEQPQLRRADRLPDEPRQPRRRRAERADPAGAGLARARPERRRHGPRHLPLRRGRRDAARLAPSGRDGRARPARRSAGTSTSPRTSPRRPPRATTSCG